MGTSNSYGGPNNGTPLVPSWLGGGGGPLPPPPPPPPPPENDETGEAAPAPMPAPPAFAPIPAVAPSGRFTAARNNLSRFARSGGRDRASLGRAISNYVSTSSGGSRAAAQRLGSSRASGARLLGFLSGTVADGVRETLRALNLEHLAGRPIEQVFLGLVEYICPEGGTVDEGIAREAFIETIADLAEHQIDLDHLTSDQIQTIFELYATHTIEARLCNDIGTKAIMLPGTASDAARIQVQILDFVRRGVADALTRSRAAMQALTRTRIAEFVDRVYEQAFSILQALGDSEGSAT